MNEPETPGAPAPEAGSPEPTPAIPTPAAAEPAAESPSLAARLAGVLFSPAATFRALLPRSFWAGALAAYVVLVGVFALSYGLRVDWEAMMRAEFENSLAFRMMMALAPEGQIDQIERAAINEILDTGQGGMTLITTLQSVLYGGLIPFHIMLIIFATLFYLMGSLEDLRLGRVYLDAFTLLILFIVVQVGQALMRGLFGDDPRGALPWQAGLQAGFLVLYAWMLHRSIERQPTFRKLAAVNAHALAVPAIAMILSTVVVLVSSEAVTVGADRILRANVAAILGMEGTGPLTVFLGALDVFRLWSLAILSIGFSILTRFSLGTSFAITFLPWGFLTMARIAMAFVFSD